MSIASARPEGSEATSPSWVPIRGLSARHRPALKRHMLSLNERDRYLRFGFIASDAQIRSYVEGIDFERDQVLGIFNRSLRMVASAHLAYLPPMPGSEPQAEFGVSVLESHRGRGFGARLFRHAMVLARNRHVGRLVIHALSENVAMLRIARKAGAELLQEGGDAQASLRLPPEDLASRVEELVEQRAAQVDYKLKSGAKRVSAFMNALGEVQTQLDQADSTGVAKE
jgi:RimJ/RimL family protein N-acetyltransferase